MKNTESAEGLDGDLVDCGGGESIVGGEFEKHREVGANELHDDVFEVGGATGGDERREAGVRAEGGEHRVVELEVRCVGGLEKSSESAESENSPSTRVSNIRSAPRLSLHTTLRLLRPKTPMRTGRWQWHRTVCTRDCQDAVSGLSERIILITF